MNENPYASPRTVDEDRSDPTLFAIGFALFHLVGIIFLLPLWCVLLLCSFPSQTRWRWVKDIVCLGSLSCAWAAWWFVVVTEVFGWM